MVQVPSLVSLCIWATKEELIRGDDVPSVVYDLPSDLFDALVSHLPPLALQKLQMQMPFECRNSYEYDNDGLAFGRKRGRFWIFNTAWRTLFNSRWPQLGDYTQAVDWQQLYWETHVQNCLDEAAAVALLPSFSGYVGEILIPDSIMRSIGYERSMNISNQGYLTLSHHCQQFGHYARCLRLQSVLCVAEICHLLRNSKLQTLVLRWIRFQEQVEGLCKLLSQNSDTLTSVEFIHCKLSSDSIDAICTSLHKKSEDPHGIQHLSINASSFDETNPDSLPTGLVSFLSSGRCLCSFKLTENHLGRNFAKLIFRILLDASSGLSTLDLSENDIAGWLSEYNWRSSIGPQSFSQVGKPLQCLRVLNIRANNLHKDDADNLRYALVQIPNLEVLDISDNPIGDDGIRNLVPYLIEASERFSPFADLNLENCEVSCDGVIRLIDTLSTLKKPLRSLSVADNSLGSQVAAAMVKLLEGKIQVINISGIGLGSFGFRELQGFMGESKVVNINISKNRGGIETAKFLLKLLSHASEVVAVNASYNIMPVESLTFIHSALKVAKGSLELLDLRGNTWDYQHADTSSFAEFQSASRKILVVSSVPTSDAPYDDDP